MMSFLKTLLHLLSVVVLCTAMAACSQAGGGSKEISGHYSSHNMSITHNSTLDY
jgi:hypothetical protein